MINSSVTVVFLYIAILPILGLIVCLVARLAICALSLRCDRHDFVVRALFIWFLFWMIGGRWVTKLADNNQLLIMVVVLVLLSIAVNTAIGSYLGRKSKPAS